MPTGKSSNQISVVLTQDVRAALEDFAKEHYWSLSKAASVLIIKGLGLDTANTSPAKADDRDKEQVV